VCAPFKRERASNTREPVAEDANNQCQTQRHSAPGSAKSHEVSGARK
jgi:hypothetical protein